MSTIPKRIINKHFFNLYRQIRRNFSVTSSIPSESNIIKSDSTDIELPGPDLTLAEVLFSAIEPYHKLTAIVSK